jgi:hypothetical protein
MAETNLKHPPQGCNPGERVMFRALKRYLPADYFVWYEPTVFGRKRSTRPDFVVLGPDIGLVVVEVKDWSLERIHSANRDVFKVRQGQGISVRTNPEQQVRGYIFDLIRELERYRVAEPARYGLLVEQDGPHRGRLQVPVSGLVALANIGRAEWRESTLGHVLNEATTLLRDDLGEGLLDRLRQAAVFRTSLSAEQIATVRWMLYPETRVVGMQGRLFTLDAEQMNLTQVDTFLPPEALRLARKPQVKLVRGVVGSGKTLILLYRAKFISEQNPRWRVLVLAYNRSLKDYLSRIFAQLGGDPARVEIVNFHKWCYDLLSSLGSFKPPLDEASQRGLVVNLLKELDEPAFEPQFLVEEFNWIKEQLHYRRWADYMDPQKVSRTGRGHGLGREEAPKRRAIFNLFRQYQGELARHKLRDWADIPVQVLQAMDQGRLAREQYHAILIDEVQDFAPAWFRVAFGMLKPETKMLFLAGDGTQRIYRRDFTWKALGLELNAQNSYILRRSYRSTREIIDLALEVVRDSQTLRAEMERTGEPLVEPERDHAEARFGPLPVLLGFKSAAGEAAGIAGEILSLLQQGYVAQDIVILLRHRDQSEQIVRELHRQGIAARPVKGDLDVGEPVVKVCTVHSAKGLEFEVVFICGLNQFKINEPVDTESDAFQRLLDQERKLLYVGMTRARRILYISYSGDGPEWILARLGL